MFTREKSEMKRVPMMPVRDMVIFPQMMQPFIVGREASVRALEEALAGEKKIFLATQHDASVDDPKPEEIFTVGTLANIVQSVKLPDGNIRVLVEGVERAKIVQLTSEEGFYRASLRLLPNRVEPSPQMEQAVRRVNGLFEQYVKLSQSLNYDTMIAAAGSKIPPSSPIPSPPICRFPSKKSRNCSKTSTCWILESCSRSAGKRDRKAQR